LGDFDDDSLVAWTKIPEDVVACKEHKQLALDMARKSIVLLKNDDILPLRKGHDIVVVGANATDSVMMWGNYSGFPSHTVTAMEGIKRFAPNAKFIGGCGLTRNETTADSLLQKIGNTETVIFIGGISPKLEGEEMKVSEEGFKGGDRTSIELPKAQRDMLNALKRAGKNVVFVNCSGSAMALVPEQKSCAAIIQAWYGGEQGGEALAEVLFGQYNPSGKLPVTFYRSTDDLPDFLDYTMKNRTYRYFTGKALYPFGYGLSYTTFYISKPKYEDGSLQVSVKNTGKVSGTETLQVYVRNTSDKEGPLKTLRGYKQVTLTPGEQQTVSIDLPRESFEGWDSQTNTMRVVPGKYEVMVGNSSSDDSLKKIIVEIN
jgi:beta-glucosidase